MQEHEMSDIDKINEDELESVTGGCGACAPDERIVNAVDRISESITTLARNGEAVPANIMSRNDIRQALNDGRAAMARINQRHPGTFDIPQALDAVLNRMNQRRPGRG